MDSMTHRAARAAGAGMDTSHESASLMTEAAPPPVGGWTTDDVSIKQASNGGFIVRCSRRREAPSTTGPQNPGESYKSDELAFGSIDEVLSFVSTEFGGAPAEPEVPAAPEMAMDDEPADGYEDMA